MVKVIPQIQHVHVTLTSVIYLKKKHTVLALIHVYYL